MPATPSVSMGERTVPPAALRSPAVRRATTLALVAIAGASMAFVEEGTLLRGAAFLIMTLAIALLAFRSVNAPVSRSNRTVEGSATTLREDDRLPRLHGRLRG